MAAGLSVDLDRWRQEFDELMLRVGARFARVEPRRRMAAFVRGLLAGLPRVNCWSIAEHAGEDSPRGMQRLLSAAAWDEAGVRDDLRGYVLEHFTDPGAVLVVDETGDLKRAPPRWALSGSTPAPPGGPRTPRSRCTWRMPPRPGPRSSTGPCTCPGPGRPARPGAGPPGCPRAPGSPPSPRWPGRCSPAPWAPGRRPRG